MLLDKIKLEDDEEIVIQTRRHWFIPLSQLFGIALTLIIPPAAWFITDPLSVSTIADLQIENLGAIVAFLYCLLFLYMWTGIFSVLTNYYLDILTLTDRRVIVVNQRGFFHRNVASFRLERLQDMNIDINGFLATMLDFGNIDVETAGNDDEPFEVTGIPHPRELKAAILKASDQRLTETNHTLSNEGL